MPNEKFHVFSSDVPNFLFYLYFFLSGWKKSTLLRNRCRFKFSMNRCKIHICSSTFQICFDILSARFRVDWKFSLCVQSLLVLKSFLQNLMNQHITHPSRLNRRQWRRFQMCILNLLKISFKHSRIHKLVSFSSGSLSALFFSFKKKCTFRYIICIRRGDKYEINK